MQKHIALLFAASLLLAACNQAEAPDAAKLADAASDAPLSAGELGGHVTALGENGAWRADVDPTLGFVLKFGEDTRSAAYAAPVDDGANVRFASAPYAITLTRAPCTINGVAYPMQAALDVGDGSTPANGCAFVRWDAELASYLPAIDACLSVATEPMAVIYAAPESEARMFVRLRYEGETFDCHAPLDPGGGEAAVAPADAALHYGGEGEAIFVRAPGDNPGGECYEAPEVRAPDGALLGWWEDPEGC